MLFFDVHSLFFLIILALYGSLFVNCSNNGAEVDVAWEFNVDIEGWANATSEEMQMEVRTENGELRASIIGDVPNIKSPRMYIDTSRRHYCVIRMMYFGGATEGELYLHSGGGVMQREDLDSIVMFPFELDNTGVYKNYYLPIHQYLSGPLLTLRFQFPQEINTKRGARRYREGLSIDYIRIVRSPEVWRTRGCLDKYFGHNNMVVPYYNVTSSTEVINGHLSLYSFVKNQMPEMQYASTYDCPLTGNVNITVDGINFGRNARVFIDQQECPVLEFISNPKDGERVETLICQLPASKSYGAVNVRVQNGILPGLFQELSHMFQYRTAPAVPAVPIPTNIGATRIDLVWQPAGDEFAHMSVTGYKIIWFQPQYRTRVSNCTVGNVTTTSIRGLEPGTEYIFAIAAVSEGSYHERAATWPTDLYGRRDLSSSALVSSFSAMTEITGTTVFDFDFSFFNANASTNSSAVSPSASMGPTGQWGSEGHYGLAIVGSANIQNCNTSSTCCDNYDPLVGLASCGTHRSVCADLLERRLASDVVINGITRRQVPSNIPYENGSPPEITVLSLAELYDNAGANLPSRACGPALRLTPSNARESGSTWYNRKVNVGEGFDTTFTFELSNPSQTCNVMDDVSTYCRSRGADGLAFVIQGVSPVSLGNSGSGLGYEGIANSLAVEIDTFHNFDQMDYYENHISILTQGWRQNITANHSSALATTNRVPDLTDGVHTMRIKYDPNFDPEAVLHPSFQVTAYTSFFIENADYQYGGEGDWGTGFGLISVYMDDMYSPVITTPLNLEDTLKLDDGRMYVGLTAATGDTHWQVHDILSWQFKSLFIDKAYEEPLRVNDIGAFECINEEECVHAVDYDHYLRTNKKWGSGYDDAAGYQTGEEGYCAFC